MRTAKLRALLVLVAVAAEANTLTVCNSGCGYNNLQAAVNAAQPGDTIMLTAGQTIPCDANLPYTNSPTPITIQSSQMPELPPAGYRVGPQYSSLMPHCVFSTQGIVASAEVHGFNQAPAYQTFTVANSTFTLNAGNSFASNGIVLANGTQVEFEINNELNGDTIPPNTVAIPSPLTILTHYYVVNCSTAPACGQQGSTFQIAATPGGPPITITACDASCQAYTEVGIPVSVDPSTGIFTSPDGIHGWTNGTPIAFGTGGLQLGGNAPSPVQQDQIYYVINLSGPRFQIATIPNGTPLAVSDVGTGMLSAANTNVAHHWVFQGIEFSPASGVFLFNMLTLGSGSETSRYGMVNNIEIDRCYLHDFSNAQNGPRRGIAENGAQIYIHDSYISGMKDQNSDAQAIGGWGSYGPTYISNNFLEASGENILYGGSWPTYFPLASQNKTVRGNFIYKPFTWKWTLGSGAPSGTCLFDQPGIDPNHFGGEFYLDNTAHQGYLCSGGTWTMTGTTPNHYGVKNLVESKSAHNFLYYGNYLQGSWTDQQAGQAFTFGQAEGSGPGFANDHITVMNNQVQNVYLFLTSGSRCTGQNSGVLPCLQPPSNHTYYNNLGLLGGKSYCGVSTVANTCGTGINANLWAGFPASYDIFQKNTILTPDGIGGPPYFPTSWFYENTIPPGGAIRHNGIFIGDSIGSYDVGGDNGTNGFCGTGVFSGAFQNSTFNHNALIGTGCTYNSSGGSTNTFSNWQLPSSQPALGFVNPAGGDYHLIASSAYSAQNLRPAALSSDGTDLGAEVDAVNMATSGAVVGTPAWDGQTGATVVTGSTQAVIPFTAPTYAACTATVYQARARTTANQVTSVADTAAGSVSDGRSREIYISGLSPLRTYWYSLDCGSGELLVGNFTTLAPGQGTSQMSFDWSSPTGMQYAGSSNLSNAVSLPPATRQLIPVAPNSVVYAQAGNGGPITILIAP